MDPGGDFSSERERERARVPACDLLFQKMGAALKPVFLTCPTPCPKTHLSVRCPETPGCCWNRPNRDDSHSDILVGGLFSVLFDRSEHILRLVVLPHTLRPNPEAVVAIDDILICPCAVRHHVLQILADGFDAPSLAPIRERHRSHHWLACAGEGRTHRGMQRREGPEHRHTSQRRRTVLCVAKRGSGGEDSQKSERVYISGRTWWHIATEHLRRRPPDGDAERFLILIVYGGKVKVQKSCVWGFPPAHWRA